MDRGAAIFAGNVLPDGSQPLAQAYAGHQFGHFTALGDGRAILLGEQITPAGDRVDIQLKGSGQTRFSRRGDGRAALGPMLREYIISEAMHALGIPTTRSLAVATTGEPVYRETVLEGAVLTRVAASHIRVGTMEWAAAHRDDDAMRALADYTSRRHYPGARQKGRTVTRRCSTRSSTRQARLIAQWQLVGFIHGVMNTDNMALSGETIDYGPCAFMDAYDPATVFSSIDSAAADMPTATSRAIAQWNLARLAEAMLPLLHPQTPSRRWNVPTPPSSVSRSSYETPLAGRACAASWDCSPRRTRTAHWPTTCSTWMHRTSADFTNTFRSLSTPDTVETTGGVNATFAGWRCAGRRGGRVNRNRRPTADPDAAASNPAVIPRNHKVEEALEAATARHDLSPMRGLLAVFAAPFDDGRDVTGYDTPGSNPLPYRTFCGT